MTFKGRNFNHEEDDFHLAVGISEETKNICRERIFFSSFSNALQADELFDDIDDVPKQFRTVTGDLERLLSMITNPIEYEYTLLTFMMYQRMAKEVYSLYRNTDEDSAESREEQIKMQIIKSIMKLKELKQRLNHAVLSDQSQVFNTARIEALELDNLMEVAYASAVSALTREESRGAHSREDFPKRDDKNWLKHLLYFTIEDKIAYRAVNRKPLTVPPMELKDRVY